MKTASIITPTGQIIEIDIRRDVRRRRRRASTAVLIVFGLPVALFLMLWGH
jgi:hypothetical protein